MARGRGINVIYSDNGAGLLRDAWVVREALEQAGHRVWLTPRAPRRFPLALNYAPELARQLLRNGTQRLMKAYARRAKSWDVNVFLDRLVPEYFDSARINCLIPNQEWLPQEDRNLLGDIDLVLFKTRHAMSLLQAETKHAEYVGFTSLDIRDPSVSAKVDSALHICGWNPHKGTNAVIGAWTQHPEWPPLTVVTQLTKADSSEGNITRLTSRITDRHLHRLQNECAVHVCPSEVEGFGHTLMEALSCGAVLVTTNAPPMHELLLPDEGILVPHTSTAPMGAGTRYIVDERDLGDAIARIWTMNSSMLAGLRRAARARYDSSRAFFHQHLARAIREI